MSDTNKKFNPFVVYTQAAVPVVGSCVTRQARRVYVGNIPFGFQEQVKGSLVQGQRQYINDIGIQ